MKRRTLGKNVSTVGEVGLGCWQFGGDFGAMEEGTAHEIMSASLQSGVDFFDTSNVYGAGRREEWIGKFFAMHTECGVVATKYGRDPDTYPATQAMENVEVSALPPLPNDLHEEFARFYRDEVSQHIRGPY